jgi:sialic acid synthase SpsE
MGLAREMIHEATRCGADVAKFQLLEIEKVFPPKYEYLDIVKKAQLSFDDITMLKKECDKSGIEFMSSVFDLERIEWLEKIGVKRYKLASRIFSEDPTFVNKETIKLNRLIREKIFSLGKDVIVSLGAFGVNEFPDIGPVNCKVDFLYCVAKYPAIAEDLHFSKVDFTRYTGFSDHTIGIEASTVAIAKGARIIEKHFTLDKNLPGPDHGGSMIPGELKCLVDFKNKFLQML